MKDRTVSRNAISVLRVAVALLLFVHGVARVVLGIVDDFGLFLGGIGLPFATALAWAITVVELLGGLLLAMGRWTRSLALLFSVELAVGILLVHARAGWFVVGAGRNGMEYSVLLIVVLWVVAYSVPSGHSR